MLDRATVLPGCAHDAEITKWESLPSPRFSAARDLAELSTLRTELWAYQGKGDKAVESAITALRMRRIFEPRPILIAYLMRLAITSLPVSEVPLILRYGNPSAQGLEPFSRAVIEMEESYSMTRVYMGERAYELAFWREFRPASPYVSLLCGTFSHEEDSRLIQSVPYRWWGWWIEPLARTWLVSLLRTHSRMIEAASKPWAEMPDAMKKVAEESKSPFLYTNIVGTNPAASGEDTSLLVASTLARTRCAYVAVMIERYERAKHKLPDGLADVEAQFGVKMPSDPFTGNSLIYRKKDRGYVVYSVGQDKKDDGGEELAEFDSGDCGLFIRH
jgi:hypothetical protein